MRRGFACGVFDLFHAGHVMMLKECKENCDYLVVAINQAENLNASVNPGKEAPLYPFEHRKLIVQSCRYVDEVVGYNSEEELEQIMRAGAFSVRFLGEDYRGKVITAPDAIDHIHWVDRSHGLSSSHFKMRLREREGK